MSGVHEGFSSYTAVCQQNYRLDVCHNEYSREYLGIHGLQPGNRITAEFVSRVIPSENSVLHALISKFFF